MSFSRYGVAPFRAKAMTIALEEAHPSDFDPPVRTRAHRKIRVAEAPKADNTQALAFAMTRSHGTALAKNRLVSKLYKNQRRGIAIAPEDALWRKTLCVSRLMQGDFSNWDGWQHRTDYAATCWFEGEDRLGLPMWDWGPTEHLFILAEEGVGDEVLFMSLLPEALVRCPKVTVECDQRLESVLKRSFPRTHTVARLGTLTKIREWLTGLDPKSSPSAWILMGDLARGFRLDRSHFPGKPYLRPDPERVRELERFRGRIGISWSGNHGRYPPAIFGTRVTQPINLQYDEKHPSVEEPGIDLKNDLEGLFALCSVLGRVVTVSTSIAHIAGSVGCPVDVIHAPSGSGGKNDMDILNWKWPEGKNPWYGSATAYRNLKQYEMTR